MEVQSYRDLIVWQKAMDLVEETYKLIKLLPKEEQYALADQMRRSVMSIPSNIAEGQGRKGVKELSKFLSIAQGSKAELQTKSALMLTEEIGKLIFSTIKKLTIN